MTEHLDAARVRLADSVRQQGEHDLGMRSLRATVGHIMQHLDVTAALTAAPGQPTSTQTMSVLRDVADERQRQDEKWGPVSRPPLEWLSILAEEFGEVAQVVTKGCVPPESDMDWKGYRTELIQLAAVCVSAVECLDFGTAGLR